MVLIMADQHHAGMSGCYGDSLVETPAIDKPRRRRRRVRAEPAERGGVGRADDRLPRAPH